MPKRRESIAELQAKIASLENLRPELGDDIVNQKIDELRARIQAGSASAKSRKRPAGRGQSLQSGDSSVAVQGDVNDSAIFHAQTVVIADRFWRGQTSSLPAPDLKQATASYLAYLVDRHNYLSLKGMGVADRIPLRLPLLDVYVPLKARLELPEGETWKRDLSLAGRLPTDEDSQPLRLSEPLPLLNILSQRSGLIILGDPGAGKTTFLKYLALLLARGEGRLVGLEDRLPILLPLAAYANALQEADVRLDDFIAEYFSDIGADHSIGPMLAEALRAGRALILLDGLDEVRDLNLRNTVVERVMDFFAFHRRPGNKFVLTSRIVGYRAVRPSAEGLLECTLVDFDDSEIEEFVQRWMAAIEKQAQGDTDVARGDADQDRRELLDAIYQNAGVRRLASTPLLLTILALMKRQGVTLPERRVQLYDQYVTTLLSTWNRARSLSGRAPSRDLDELQTVRVLAPLALWMHEISPGVGLVKREELGRKLEEIFKEQGSPSPANAARQFLQDVREHAALLLERGPGEFGFIHLTFEEYLSAAALALKGQGEAKPIAEALLRHVGEQAWRETTLLTIGYIGVRQQLSKVAGEVVELLAGSKDGAPGEAAVLAGEAVLDTWPGGVPLQSKDRVLLALAPTMQKAEVHPDLRRRAGLLLGRLGWRPPDLDRFMEIAAGEFLFGAKKDKVRIENRFWIAKYPVTNGQFARFVQAGGYQTRALWSDIGWAWRTGKYDERTLETIERDWLDHRPQTRRNAPYFWYNIELGNPIFPVVGVSWYEAEAYCNWLAKNVVAVPDGYTVRLPNTTEWEFAARGQNGHEYPWGDGFDKTAANTWDSDIQDAGLGGTTAVCTFPQGTSPAGAWDMSGNVWEWTCSWYDDDRRYRVVRGGSWIGYQWFARAAFCNWSIPLTFNDDLGFRVAIAPLESL
ncbi:MAG: SUMF1/EgtB/PvdO family nonheme iron enzyme [Anaerolineales bacterium]|nr:SUMF1/EgtB/PvdO family nonheme iron enzyme [Anaerolineales bacterium]MCZ2288603.1 SUMF1/EgtB/PvdO family nonheme iron enzyme [Anaerolineales bacterium]